MRKMARMKRQRSYSENSTLDALKMASDVMKPLNITTSNNSSSSNDTNWRKSSVLPRRRYLSVGKNMIILRVISVIIVYKCIYYIMFINLGEKSGDSKGMRTITKVTFELNKKGSSTIEENTIESPKKCNSSENQ